MAAKVDEMTTPVGVAAGETTETLNTSKQLCRYHLHGACDKGSQCEFSHDRTLSPSMVCRYYQHGMCRYGDRCRYDHVKNKSGKAAIPLTKPSGTSLTAANDSKVLKHFDSTSQPKAPLQQKLSVAAAEFVPGQPYQGAGSYASTLRTSTTADVVEGASAAPIIPQGNKYLLCPYAIHGDCPYGDDCVYTHGDVCELCGLPVLYPGDRQQNSSHSEDGDVCELCGLPVLYPGDRHQNSSHSEHLHGNYCVYTHGDVCELCGLPVLYPGDRLQNSSHSEECQKLLEKDMEISFQIAQSQSKECGICMETVMEKEPPTERRFGILSNCNHIFCLECIRKWRKEKNFDSKAIRSCPECRVLSDFVTPSDYWVETREEKDKLIEGYKIALKKKPCQYFKKGAGECPFNEHCFYAHTYPDGRIASPKPRRRRRRENANGDLDLLQQILIWDFFEERESQVLQALELELSDMLFLANFDDSSSSDTDSDFDF